MDRITGWFPDENPVPAKSTRIAAWIIGLVGLLIFLTGSKTWIEAVQAPERSTYRIAIKNPRRFLWSKLLLWLGALPIAAVLGSLFFFTPVPVAKPVFNLIYVGFIGGYGILHLILYWRGKMPGTHGKLPFEAGNKPIDWKRLLIVLGIVVGMLALTAAYARTGLFTLPLVRERLIWLGLFVPFTAIGFWIGQHEGRMLQISGGTFGSQLALTLIGLFPFFLYTILMAAIGSLSGMIGGLQGLLFLWLVLVFGEFVQVVGRRRWLTAVCMAVLLYWLILPQGVLFG